MSYITKEAAKKAVSGVTVTAVGDQLARDTVKMLLRILVPKIRHSIDQVPEEDAVQVVRCANCRHLRHGRHNPFCAYWDVDSYEEAVVSMDDFCSHGEANG